MLKGLCVLVAEDQILVASDLAEAVKEAGGEVAGPVSSVSDAIELLSRVRVEAAILDVALLDGEVTPVAIALLEQGKAVLFHTASAVPQAITVRFGGVPIYPKPAHSRLVISKLASVVAGAAGHDR